MKLKSFSLLLLFSGIILIAFGFLLPIWYGNSVSIIGGADASTLWQIMETSLLVLPHFMIVLGVALIVTSLFCLVFSKTVNNCCAVKTSVAALGVSAFFTIGIYCVFEWYVIAYFSDAEKYPIAYPASIVGGMLSFVAFVALSWLYVMYRKQKMSVKGVVIDVLTFVLYFPVFVYALAFIVNIIELY